MPHNALLLAAVEPPCKVPTMHPDGEPLDPDTLEPADYDLLDELMETTDASVIQEIMRGPAQSAAALHARNRQG